MIAHVLCPGPSLPRTFRRFGFGPVIAVNRAVDFTCADWLVAGDAVTFGRIRCRPMQGICSFAAVLRDGVPPDLRRLRTIAWEDLWHGHGDAPQWGVQAAMYLACHLAGGRLQEIVLFGVDLVGTDDWDGTAPIDDRSASRWQREAAAIATTTRYLTAELGVTVTRVQP